MRRLPYDFHTSVPAPPLPDRRNRSRRVVGLNAPSPRRPVRRPSAPAGFTFVEILAAMLFMAIVIPVAIEGLLLANAVQRRAAGKRHAAELAARVLNEAVATESWRNGDQEGDFGDDFPGLRWTLTTTAWSADVMRLITVSVTYPVQDRVYTESLSTLAPEQTATTEASR